MARSLWSSLWAVALVLGAQAAARAEVDGTDLQEIVSLRSEALAYEHGEGVRKDPARAVQLYCKAAKLGDAEAQYSLGWMYANARGVTRDDALASLFFTLAEKQGHEHARRMLRFVGEPTAEIPECLRDKPVLQAHVSESPSAQPEPPALEPFLAVTPSQKLVLNMINELAPQYGVFPRLALAIVRAESNFDPTARSEKNAQGLMQLIPETAARFNVSDPLDPAQNIRGGLSYLRWLLSYFQGDVSLVAAAYNAGEGVVNRYRGIPPYPETRQYVKRITELFGKNEHPYDARVTEPSRELYRIRANTVSLPGPPTVAKPVSREIPRQE